MEFKEGIYLIDKKVGPTSFDVVGFLRKKSGIRKIGHAGTLDPLASGLLIVAIGRENTKRIDEFMKLDKEYEAEINLEAFSETDDNEGEKEKVKIEKKPTKKDIEECLKEFTGEIWQTPPLYSAIKIKGKPAYKYARKGNKIKIEAKKIKISKIEIIDYEFPIVRLRINCGSGTYIRSLAHDLGKKLNTGGYLTALRRTKIGDFSIDSAIELEMS